MTETEAQKIDGRSREGRLAREAERQQANAQNEAAVRATVSAAEAVVETPTGKRITRDNRKGFGNQSQKLAYSDRVGYHRHWFNDTPGRIVGAQESGYTHVKDDATGKNLSHIVGVAASGGPLTAYLMEIPEEWWRDDMAEQEKINVAKEETIKRGARAGKSEDDKNFYPTAQGRQMQVITRR